MGNELMDIVSNDLNAALDREVALRRNYEEKLIPQLERDLHVAHADVEALTTEVLSLRSFKGRASIVLDRLDVAQELIKKFVIAGKSAQESLEEVAHLA